MVDGAYHLMHEELKPGVRENDIVAMVNEFLYRHGSDDVEAINAISGERCNPHPHNFTDRMLRPGDQAFFDILQSFMGYRTCYYRTFNVGRATPAQHDAYKKAREWLDNAIALIKPGVSTDKVASVWPKAEEFGFPDEMSAFGLQFGHGLGCAMHERPIISRVVSLDHPTEIKEGMVFALETYCPATDGYLGRAHRGGGRGHRQGLPRDHAVPGGGTADREPVLMGSAPASRTAPGRLKPDKGQSTQGDSLTMKIGSFKALLAAGLMLTLGAFATPAGAQRPDDMRTGQGGGGNPCVGDAQKICNEFIPDRGKVASCLFKNKAKLTPACRAELGGGSGKTVGKSAQGQAPPPPVGFAALTKTGRDRGRFLLLRIHPMSTPAG